MVYENPIFCLLLFANFQRSSSKFIEWHAFDLWAHKNKKISHVLRNALDWMTVWGFDWGFSFPPESNEMTEGEENIGISSIFSPLV